MSEHAIIVEDAYRGYDITVSYNGSQFIATCKKDSTVVIRAIFHRGNVEAVFSEEMHPMLQLVQRINDHLFRYTKVYLEMPGQMQSVSGLWRTSSHKIATTW
jgi:hypothetical protein